MYMLTLIWDKDVGDVFGHNICMVKKLPDPHVTKWMLEEMQIAIDGAGIVRDGTLIARNKAKTIAWCADPKNYKWKRVHFAPSEEVT